MKKLILLVFLILSCPRSNIKKIFEPDYLKEALQYFQYDPIYAYNILQNNIIDPDYIDEKFKILVRIYLDQREYERAAQLLDSINWSIEIDQDQAMLILLKTKRWQKITELTTDTLLKGIAYYQLGAYEEAVKCLTKPAKPGDYRGLYLAKTYCRLNDFEHALDVFLGIDSLSPYLFQEYQNLLFDILSNIENIDIIKKESVQLKEPALRDYIYLKIYEKENDKNNLLKTSWELIKNYPASAGAYYALQLVTPYTKLEYKSCGKVDYLQGDYDNAIKYLRKSNLDNEVNYYLGRIYFEQGQHSKAMAYLDQSNWAASYYYRARIYEDLGKYSRAIAIYDSLYTLHDNSSYAKGGLKRKAFILEDIGDTLKAVETFLKVGEANAQLRAALQLFRIGKLEQAKEILDDYALPEFIYWQGRIKERLGESAESLKNFLSEKFPLSYYSLARTNNQYVLDSMSLDTWLCQFGDTTLSFDQNDSLRLNNAIKYFCLNESKYATKELNMIEPKTPKDLFFLSYLCAQYGADPQSVTYGLKLKKLAEKSQIKTVPLEILRLLYPIRYVFSIIDQRCELSLCLAIIRQESLFSPEALSSADAKGLMQMIPKTAELIAHDLDISQYSLDDATTSIKFGWRYFSKLLSEFNSVPLSLAAYNAGPIRLRRWLAKNPNSEIDEFIELIPYNETKNYVKSVLAHQIIYKNLLPNRH